MSNVWNFGCNCVGGVKNESFSSQHHLLFWIKIERKRNEWRAMSQTKIHSRTNDESNQSNESINKYVGLLIRFCFTLR